MSKDGKAKQRHSRGAVLVGGVRAAVQAEHLVVGVPAACCVPTAFLLRSCRVPAVCVLRGRGGGCGCDAVRTVMVELVWGRARGEHASIDPVGNRRCDRAGEPIPGASIRTGQAGMAQRQPAQELNVLLSARGLQDCDVQAHHPHTDSAVVAVRIGAALVYFHDWASAATVSRGWARCSREATWLPAQSRGSTRPQQVVEPVSAVSVIDVVGGAAVPVAGRLEAIAGQAEAAVRQSRTVGDRRARPCRVRVAADRVRDGPRDGGGGVPRAARRSCARWLGRSRRARWGPAQPDGPPGPAPRARHTPAVRARRPLSPSRGRSL